MRKKKILIAILLIVLLAVLKWIYYYPVQRTLCQKAFKEYISLQGISEADIDSSRTEKIPWVNGWKVVVCYKKDLDNIYEYMFFIDSNYGKKMSVGRMICDIKTKGGEDAKSFLYPPLPENE